MHEFSTEKIHFRVPLPISTLYNIGSRFIYIYYYLYLLVAEQTNVSVSACGEHPWLSGVECNVQYSAEVSHVVTAEHLKSVVGSSVGEVCLEC